tara:strand:+ start:1391 stop:1783 length:393 start_codon:yes stop_codon:yes gene_type:complete
MAHNPWNIAPGINNVGSFQVSGRPWAYTAAISNSASLLSFPDVTRWVTVRNTDSSIGMLIAFSAAGLGGTEHFTLAAGTEISMEVKISQLWVIAASGTPTIAVVAGLTNINASGVATDDGPSWSGSVGVG